MPKEVTILIIEDDKYLNDLLCKKLAGAGFTALAAIDAEEGLKSLKKNKTDLILLDLLLPGMHGFEFLEIIKKDPSTKDIPVIIISNLGQKEDVEKGLALGADDYLVKAGVTLDEIIRKVNNLLPKEEKASPQQ